MPPKLYWIREQIAGDQQLCMMKRPEGHDQLEQEIQQLEQAGIRALVCLLEPQDLSELGLSNEKKICREMGIEFFNFPIPDYGTPADAQSYLNLIAKLDQQLQEGQKIAIHCYMGIGRSSLIAAGILIKRGLPWREAFARIGQHRGHQVPETKEQEAWMQEIAEQI